MVRVSGSAEADAWRRRMRRFEGAGLTVGRFCEKEGVSTASFYRWRKRLAELKNTAGSDGHGAAFKTVRVTTDCAAVTVLLAGGMKIEVPADELDAVRTVVGEILRYDTKQGYRAGHDRGSSTC